MNCSTQLLKSTDQNNWKDLYIFENAANRLGCVFSYLKLRNKYQYIFNDEVFAEIDALDYTNRRPVWRVVIYKDGMTYHKSGFLDENMSDFLLYLEAGILGVKAKQRDLLKKEIEEESRNPY